MNPDELAQAYPNTLGRADLTAVLRLFRDGAIVRSPPYGPIVASDSYPVLFADSMDSRLTLRGVTHGSTTGGAPLVTI